MSPPGGTGVRQEERIGEFAVFMSLPKLSVVIALIRRADTIRPYGGVAAAKATKGRPCGGDATSSVI